MGMDVMGKNPTTKEGEYFRNNVWWWRPLADYILATAPKEITSKCAYWQSNDGAGLNGRDSVALATFLEGEIAAGRTEAYGKRYASQLASLPKERCHICAGTGTRLPIPHCGAGDPKKGGLKCNGCGGEGYIENMGAHYPFSVANVQQFIAFLKGCGGFRIC